MRWLYLFALAACAADVPVIDDPAPLAAASVRNNSGLSAARLGRHVGLEVGFNNRRLGGNSSWSLATPTVFDAGVASLAPGALRFPGGTIAQDYDWDGATGVAAGSLYEAGSTCPSKPVDPGELHWQPFKPITSARDSNVDTLDTLRAERPAGTSVVFMLNVLVRTVYAETKMLDAAAARGIPIDRVELGNEFYYPGTSTDGTCDVYSRAFPTGADYAAVANAWARKLAVSYPHARLAVVGNERFEDGNCGAAASRFRCWNHDLLAAGLDPAIDAIAIHPYIWHVASCRSGADMYDDADSLIGAAMQMASAVLASSRGADPSHGVLGASLRAWQKSIWVTEYGYFNYSHGGHDWSNKWAAGLGVLAYALRLTSDSRVTVLLHHNITDTLWPPDDPQGRTGRAARGLALSQLDRVVADTQPTANDDVWWLDFSGAQYTVHAGCGYDGSGALDYHALVGRWFTHDYDRNGARGSSGLVVNLGARTVTLDLADFYSAAGAKVDIWSAPADAEPDDTVAPATHSEVTVDAAHHTISIPPRAIVRWHDLAVKDSPRSL